MKILRIFLAIIFACLIVVGIWKYYTSHSETQIDMSFMHWFSDNKDTTDKKNTKKDISSGLIHTIEDVHEDGKDQGNDKDTIDKDFSKGVLSSDEQDRLLQFGVRGGNKDGDIVWLHYCDFDAKYCQKSYEEGITYDYQEMIPNLAYIYKPFPPTMKSLDVLPHHAVLCASELGSQKQAIAYYTMLYKKPQARNSVDTLIQIGKDLGIDGMEQCLQQDNYNLLIQQEIKFVKKLFGIRTLPANIFINKITKERILVPGYYEKEEVKKAIDEIKGE